MPYHARTHFARLLIFTLVFTLGSLLIVPGCKSTKSTESKEETPKIQPQVTTKKNLPPRKKKRLKPQKKGNSVLYVRLRFADLFSIPQIQGKTEELKVAALKQGYLGAMLRCHLDFTSQLEMMALMVPQDFKKSRRGSLTFKGTFEAEKMARCIFADMGWKVSGKTGALLNVTGDDLSLEVDVKSPGIISMRTKGWSFVPWDKVPDAYHQFAKKTADLPALILGSMDPVIPWPDPPKAILLGLTPLLTGLKMRSIINFTSEKAAQDFVNMAKRKIVEIIGKAPKGNPPMYIEILKKTGIKRLATRILATASARWDEVISLVKQATVKVKVKQ